MKNSINMCNSNTRALKAIKNTSTKLFIFLDNSFKHERDKLTNSCRSSVNGCAIFGKVKSKAQHDCLETIPKIITQVINHHMIIYTETAKVENAKPLQENHSERYSLLSTVM